MRVIRYANIPAKYPIIPTICWWLLLDRLGVGGFGMGVFWTIAGIWWVICIALVFHQEQVDVCEGRRW